MLMTDGLLREWLARAPKEIGNYYKTTGYVYVHADLAYFEVWVKGGMPGPDGLEDYDDDEWYKLEHGKIIRVDEREFPCERRLIDEN